MERHDLLENTIGVLSEEQNSYENVTTLYNVTIYIFSTFSILEICLYCLYQYKVCIFNTSYKEIMSTILSFTHGE